MKGFFISLLLFGTLLFAIVANQRFILSNAKKIEEALQEIRDEENAPALARELEAFWKERERLFALSIPYDRLYEMHAQLTQLRIAAELNEAAELERARCLALQALEQIRRPEKLSLWGVL